MDLYSACDHDALIRLAMPQSSPDGLQHRTARGRKPDSNNTWQERPGPSALPQLIQVCLTMPVPGLWLSAERDAPGLPFTRRAGQPTPVTAQRRA